MREVLADDSKGVMGKGRRYLRVLPLTALTRYLRVLLLLTALTVYYLYLSHYTISISYSILTNPQTKLNIIQIVIWRALILIS